MTVLTISLVGNAGIAMRAPIAVEVITRDLAAAARVVVRPDLPAEIDVMPGSYLVQAETPSGEHLRTKVTVVENRPAEARLQLPTSPHEWLAGPLLLGAVEDRGDRERGGLDRLGEIWMRTWERRPPDTVWEPGQWTLVPGPADEDAAIFFCSGDLGVLRMVQVGGGRVPSRFVTIPPTDGGIDITLTTTPRPREFDGGLAVHAVTPNGHAEALLHYVSNGHLSAAIDVATEEAAALERELTLTMLSDAETFALEKRKNPAAAAVGFYFMLRTGADERMRDWPNNLANWFEWLADGPVIHAWQMLRSPAPGNVMPFIRDRLLQAVARGLPTYSYGLRLLLDGLQVVDRGEHEDLEVADAIDTVRRYAGATDFTLPLTSFLGTHPSEPSIRPSFERPSAGIDALHLPQAMPA